MEADGIAEPNIETILSQIRALKQVAGKGTVKEFTEKDLIDLDELICKTISVVVDKLLPNLETPYHGLAACAKVNIPATMSMNNFFMVISFFMFSSEKCRPPGSSRSSDG
jgi:hypothetical protein